MTIAILVSTLPARLRAGRWALALCAAVSVGGCASEPKMDWLSGPEITAALTDHTATLPGGFVEYYAPDGKVRGISDGQPYVGTWEVRQNAFCTALSGDPPVCSRVARSPTGLMWSIDGEKGLTPVDDIVPGNPRGL